MSVRIADPTAEPHFVIDGREWKIPSAFQVVAMQYDENSEVVHIDVPRYFDGVDRSGCDVYLRTFNEDGGSYEIRFDSQDLQVTDDLIIADWNLNPPQTSYSGSLKIHIIVRNGEDYQWSTYAGSVIIKELKE